MFTKLLAALGLGKKSVDPYAMYRHSITVGNLRRRLATCEDDETISFYLETPPGGRLVTALNTPLYLLGVSSTGGGRAVNIHFGK
jgi:hypothetical protein